MEDQNLTWKTQELESENIDEEASNYWLRRGKWLPGTRGYPMAIQDQVFATKNYLEHIVRM